MWEYGIESLEAGRTLKVAILRDNVPITYADTLDRWQHDEAFHAFFNTLLAEAPFRAYFWETPPVTRATLSKAFEFVLVDSLALADACPDALAFADQFQAEPADGVVGFSNLGGDAFLVAPCPRAPPAAYPHLAAFTRQAPEPQQHALWRHVGAAVAGQIGNRPLWLSTSGLGVLWLHIRLDARPKYYTFAPYRESS